MSLLAVLLLVFGVAGLQTVVDIRDEQKRVNYYRERRERECEPWKARYPNDYLKRTNFCDERYGYPRQWWEPKSHKELLDENTGNPGKLEGLNEN